MRIHDLLSSHDMARVAKLQLLARQVVEGFTSGRHRSPHKGFSVEFKEHRPYVRGDELRSIDWKVFGKSDRLYVRESEEETNLRCLLIVDCSGSMAYGGARSPGQTKYQYAQQLAASLAYLMLGQQDAVGIATFDNRPREFVPCRARPSHLRSLLIPLVAQQSRRETDLGGVLQQIAPRIRRRGLVIIISDAMGDLESIGRSFAQLIAAQHEVLFFQILDRDELDFPFVGQVQFRNLENVDHQQTVDAALLREAYLNRLESHQAQLRDLCRKHRVDLVTLTTERPLGEALHEYLALRRRIR